ncbi:MAG: hypothetical protein KatS3mg114_1084 [Planctomycetaceae bacterium]|nr:MAG: hypothetical protein KatS3mg114_1084 [Planctomycetaceae bacterium]
MRWGTDWKACLLGWATGWMVLLGVAEVPHTEAADLEWSAPAVTSLRASSLQPTTSEMIPPTFSGLTAVEGSANDPWQFEPESWPETRSSWEENLGGTGSAEAWSWMLLPDGLMYRSYIAGPHEPRFSTAFLHQSGQEVYWDSSLGGRVGIVRYGTTSAFFPEGWQLDVEGAAFLRMLPQTERDVQAVDFRIGVPVTYRQGPLQAKFGYYHISSHLGDEFLLKHPGYPRLNYSRDALVLGVGYFLWEAWRAYAELGWAVIDTSGGAKPWEIQTGVEYDPPWVTGWQGAPFAAVNVHLREEVNWGGSLNLWAGWQWRGKQSSRVFRAGLQYFNGQSAQFSFFREHDQLVGGGIRYDF